MAICRHYVHTLNCPLQDHCPNEHFDIVAFVREEMECAINGNQWPLSSFGPITNKPSIPNYIEDQSFEEIRFMYYGSTKFPQTCRKFSNAIIKSEEKRSSLIAMRNDNIEVLCKIYDFDHMAYEKPKFDFHKNAINKKTTLDASTPFFGAPTGGFPGSKENALEKVCLNELKNSLDKQICPFQQTQQTGAFKSEELASGLFTQKGSDDCRELLEGLSLKIDTISKTFEENKATTKVLQDTLDSSQTKNNDPIKKDPSILIKPKSRQRCSQTQKTIMEHIDPIKLSIQINGIMRGSHGSIIIECKNEESVKKLERHVELECGNYFDTEILYLSNPRIQISGIDRDINKFKLIGIIKSQNKLKHELKLIYTFEQINDSSKYNALVEIDEELYQKLLQDKDPYFNIGWKRCNVYDNIDVKRCNNCWGFNHTANNCLDKAYIPKRRVPLNE